MSYTSSLEVSPDHFHSICDRLDVFLQLQPHGLEEAFVDSGVSERFRFGFFLLELRESTTELSPQHQGELWFKLSQDTGHQLCKDDGNDCLVQRPSIVVSHGQNQVALHCNTQNEPEWMTSERKYRTGLALNFDVDIVSDSLLKLVNLNILAKTLKERHEKLRDHGGICRISCFSYLDACLSRVCRKSAQSLHAGFLQEFCERALKVVVVEAGSWNRASAAWEGLN